MGEMMLSWAGRVPGSQDRHKELCSPELAGQRAGAGGRAIDNLFAEHLYSSVSMATLM